jgi:hypothetical protein
VAETVSQSSLQQLTECKAKDMILDLGTTYRAGQALPTVSSFQKVWNELLPSVKGMAGVLLPTQNSGKLITDGLYGEQTRLAAQNFITVKLPSRAVDMPPWLGANQSAVTRMCPPAPPIEPVPPTIPLPPAQPQVAPVPISPTVIIPSPQPPPAPAPVTPLQPVVVHPSAPALIPEAPRPAPTPLPPTKIITAPDKTDTPILAIGIGVAIVGGALSAWLWKRRKQR